MQSQEESLSDWIETLSNYEEKGYQPGDCGTALLSNDLFGFLKRADENTQANLMAIARYIWNEMDMQCWGSREKVEAWVKKKREEKQAERRTMQNLAAGENE